MSKSLRPPPGLEGFPLGLTDGAALGLAGVDGTTVEGLGPLDGTTVDGTTLDGTTIDGVIVDGTAEGTVVDGVVTDGITEVIGGVGVKVGQDPIHAGEGTVGGVGVGVGAEAGQTFATKLGIK